MSFARYSGTLLALAISTALYGPGLNAHGQSAGSDDGILDGMEDIDLLESVTDLKVDFDDAFLAAFQDDPDAPAVERDQTGTDPRDFSSKLMPYYRFVKLENEIEVQQLVLFGMHAFSPKFAMTYELPLVKSIDYTDFGPFVAGSGGLPPGGGFSDLPTGGTSFSDLESDGDVIGMGDLILRFFYKPDWGGQIDEDNSWSLFPLVEMTLPTATDDVLGGEAWILSPGITFVADLPGDPPFGLGFIAAMNFFDFDAIKSNDRADTLRYRGRFFWLQPLSKPGPGLLDGFYLLTELQPVYDFETDDFDLWVGPEFGKIVNTSLTIYAKPGWGIDTEIEDRDFTFEVGFRWFF